MPNRATTLESLFSACCARSTHLNNHMTSSAQPRSHSFPLYVSSTPKSWRLSNVLSIRSSMAKPSNNEEWVTLFEHRCSFRINLMTHRIPLHDHRYASMMLTRGSRTSVAYSCEDHWIAAVRSTESNTFSKSSNNTIAGTRVYVAQFK